MISKKHRVLLLSIGSLPIVWGVLQGYHLLVCKPLVEWMMATFPQAIEEIPTPYPVVAALVNLAIWGTLAAMWPHVGLGHSWKPDRAQSVLVFLLICGSLLYPTFNPVLANVTSPFKEMGVVVWTMTPVHEEILFRGFLYTGLLRLFNRSPDASCREVWPVLVLGAVWFSLWHVSPPAVAKYGWHVIGIQVAATFVAGVMFNGLRHWTGSIWLVIPVHAAGNLMVSVM